MCILEVHIFLFGANAMSTKFVIRFALILFLVLVLTAIAIQFLFNPDATVILWIFAMPIILAVPILASVLLAQNEEFDIHSVN